MLTRAEMEQVIREGGSVLHGGRLISQVEQLPSAADLAQGDPVAESAVANALQEQIANLQAQLNKLTSPASSALATSGGAPSTTPPASTPGLVETFGQQIADRLIGAGLDTPEKLAATSDADLLAIEGIGEGTLKKIRATYPG